VVLTAAAIEALDDAQLIPVLALSGPASAVITTCWYRWPHRRRRRSPPVPVFRQGPEQVASLVDPLADAAAMAFPG